MTHKKPLPRLASYLLCLVLFALLPAPRSSAQQHAAPMPPPTSHPSLEVMAGQMLMAGFRGFDMASSPEIRRDITGYHLGGVILFDRDVALGSNNRNIENPAQVRALCSELQAEAAATGNGRLFIAVDQEGGRVQRLKGVRGFRETPAAAELAAEADDLLETMSAALTIGKQLNELGINLDFAPVLDVNTNPENPAIGKLGRSFSSSPAVVATHGKAFIDMLHEAGVLACVKHFPGHGSSASDSHLGLPDVSSSWSEAELAPFTAVIRSGRADMVMTAHLFNREWDPKLPASLSPHVITDMLRKHIGFNGVVVTDDLDMRAVSERFSLEERIRMAIEAGSDILLFGNNLTYDPDIVPKAHDAIVRLVREGRISEARIERSYARIMALKLSLE